MTFAVPSMGRARRRAVLALALAVALAADLTVVLGPAAKADQNEGASPAVSDAQRRIAAGALHTCAVLDSGQVQCWGANDEGQLGNNSVTTSNAPQIVPGITAALQVSAGASHTCALIHGGTVRCWGLNGSGQLGDGTTTDRLTPTAVVGLTGATAIAAGSFHTCALVAGGSVKCWGHDGSGQLGDGNNPGSSAGTSLVPVAVSGLTDAVSVAGGEFHTCAVRSTGGVSCWGHNGFGQLGDGTKADRDAPVAVSGIPNSGGHEARAVAAGNGHSCAVLDNGSARCWGANDRGQLGEGTKTASTSPVIVQLDNDPSPLVTDEQDVTGVSSVSAGEFHTCSLLSSGKARCWGDAGRGQLGDGTTGVEADGHVQKLAVEVAGLTGVSAVTTGGFHTCALAGTAMSCWGYNFHAQLGSYLASSLVPVTVTALRGAAKVGVGTHHACALVDVEAVPGTPPYETVCWGSNAQGQLGAGLDPAGVPRTIIPVRAPAAPPAWSVSAGNGHVCVLPSPTAGASCWGRNENGQLGDGTTGNRRAPAAVSGLTDATQISAHGALVGTELGHTCARRGDGTARCWGNNDSGQLGNATTSGTSTPVTVLFDHDSESGTAPVTLGGISEVAAGGRHSCALLGDSKVRCWGRNSSGQLGDDTTDDRTVAVSVLTADDGDPDTVRIPLSGVLHLAAGANHTCAVMTDGKVTCWGANSSGQLGDDSTSERHTPVEVKNIPEPTKPLTTAKFITAGDDHNCVLVASTGLRCWGENGAGQLGDGSTTDRTKPVAPAGLGDPDDDILANVPAFIYDVSAGRDDTCAVMLDTTVSCWGDNADGQLGDGIGVARLTPIAVLSLGAGVNGNHIPSPGDDALATVTGVAVSFPPPNLLTNDSDADPGDSLTAALGTQAAHGAAVVNADGTGSYTPDAGYCGPDSFTYTVTDTKATVPATVTVTIPCPNSPPVAAADNAAVLEDASVVVDVKANDSDPDGDPISLVSAGLPAYGTAQVVGGRITYTPAANWCTGDTFTYVLADGPGGHTSTGTVSVTITCVNDPPAATPDAISTAEDTPVTADLVANDPDPDGPTSGVIAFSQAAHGSVVAAGITSVTYTPAGNYCGPDSFGYTVSDGTASASTVVSVTVSCAQDAPIANDDTATTAEDTPVTRSVLNNDVDPDGDALTVVAVGPATNGSAGFTATSVTFTPSAQYCGPASVVYTVSDGASTDTATLFVSVSCVNDAPIAVDDAPSTPEDTSLVTSPLANDVDPDGDALTLSSVSDPPHGSVTIEAANTVRYTPDADYCGADTFTYTVGDGLGGSDIGAVEVSVTCVNDAPVLAPIADRTGPWGSPIALIASASDPDVGATITYALVSPPAGASINPSSGTFTWTPTAAQLGATTITVRATDGLLAGTRPFSVTVTPQAPAITYTGATSGQYSDDASVSAALRDGAGVGLPGRSVTFTIGSQTVSATTNGSGVASTSIELTDSAGPWTAQTFFAGDAGFGAVSSSTPFTIVKETVTVAFTAPALVTTTGSSAAAPLAATLSEAPDGSLGNALGGVQVSFRHLGGPVLCSATAVPGVAGQATAICTAPALALGSRAIIVSTTSNRYSGPVDVAVSTVAQAVTGSAAGAGRVGASDSFGFQAVPARRGAPTGDSIHVYRANGYAYVVRSSTITSLTVTCTSGKTKTCSATVQASGATTTPILLGDGTVASPTGNSSLRVDATDVAEPSGATVPPDRYAVAVSAGSTTTYLLGTPASQVLITAGNVRVPT